MRHFLSLGAGVQSSTLALMATHGEVTPMPEAAIFADTQDEPASVYRWLDWLVPRLAFPVHRVTVGKLSEREVLIRRSRKSGALYRRGLIPAFLDGGAPVFRHCTQEFKLRPLFREYRRLAKGDDVTQWIGVSLDEAHRMRPSRKAWVRNRYPLIELRMTRRQCREWMARHGYPQPPRSACVFCPWHSNAEWARLKREEPEDFQQAVEFERRVQAVCEQVGQARVFLHGSLTPLDRVVFAGEGQEDLGLARECEGMCGV